MFGKRDGIFRERALTRMSSPENLEALMRVVNAKDWLPLVAFAALIAAGLAWSIVGRVPTTVSARGILLNPGRVLESQTLGGGRIENLTIRPGDAVRRGQVIGRIDQFELRNRIAEDRRQLVQLFEMDRAQGSIQSEQVRLQARQTVLERDFAASEAQNQRKVLADAAQLEPVLKRRLDALQLLRTEGFIPEVSSELVQAEQAFLENASRITDATAKLKQLDVQLQAAESRETALANDNQESHALRRIQIRELEGRIRASELQLEKNGDIVSEHSGRILEVLVMAGQIVPAGARIATMEAEAKDPTAPEGPAAALIAVTYFPVGEGKRVQPGMSVQITPDTVERQRFGGIIGRVVSVSPLPVTREGVRTTIGNAEVVTGLLPEGAYVEVTSALERDDSAFSGYRWSSAGGPPARVTPGLTHTARVIVESRAPITYILPFLREVTGIY